MSLTLRSASLQLQQLFQRANHCNHVAARSSRVSPAQRLSDDQSSECAGWSDVLVLPQQFAGVLLRLQKRFCKCFHAQYYLLSCATEPASTADGLCQPLSFVLCTISKPHLFQYCRVVFSMWRRIRIALTVCSAVILKFAS